MGKSYGGKNLPGTWCFSVFQQNEAFFGDCCVVIILHVWSVALSLSSSCCCPWSQPFSLAHSSSCPGSVLFHVVLVPTLCYCECFAWGLLELCGAARVRGVLVSFRFPYFVWFSFSVSPRAPRPRNFSCHLPSVALPFRPTRMHDRSILC